MSGVHPGIGVIILFTGIPGVRFTGIPTTDIILTGIITITLTIATGITTDIRGIKTIIIPALELTHQE